MPTVPIHSVAIHEAGHAVAARVLGRGIDLVTIVPDADSLGFVRHPRPRLPDHALGRHARETWAMIALAGPLAEAMHEGTELPTEDEELALALELTLAMSATNDEAVAYVVWLLERTRTILVGHWGLVEYFAAQLLEHRTVRGREVHALIDMHLG